MAISTRDELKAAVQAFLINTTPNLVANLDTMIALAEERMSSDLRTRYQETTATLAVTTGSQTLPADFLELKSVTTSVAPKATLQGIDQATARTLYQNGETGAPKFYSISGATLNVYPTPTTITNVSVLYLAKVPALTSGAPTNWLLTRYPSAYLFATLVEAVYMGAAPQDQAEGWAARYQTILISIKNDDMRARFPRVGGRALIPAP